MSPEREAWEDGPPPDFDDVCPSEIEGDLPISHASDHDPSGERVRVQPEIQITTLLHENVDATIRALRADPNLFQRAGKLQHVTRATRQDCEESELPVVEGTPQIRSLPLATLAEKCTRYARFFRYKPGRLKNGADGKWVPTLPTKHIVDAVNARGEWQGIPQIVGILEAPSMRPDGSLITKPGYDAATGYFYSPSVEFPEIPENPSPGDGCRALGELYEVFADFPFADEPSRAVPVAETITLQVRPAIKGAIPLVALDATNKGTGKTLEADAIATIVTGRDAAKMTFPTTTYKNVTKVHEEEIEKLLGALATQGAQIALFDNLPETCALRGAPLDKVLTARGYVKLRTLGKTESPEYLWRTGVMVTGNNITVEGDTQRRTLKSRMESMLENPESRSDFSHHPLLPWVQANRPRLVVAALTVVRAYVVAGRPKQEGCETWGGFEEWAALIPPAIVFAGGTDPMLAKVSAEDARDDATDALAAILVKLPEVEDGAAQLGFIEAPTHAGLTSNEILAACYPKPNGDAPAESPYTELRSSVELLVGPPVKGVPASPRALSKALGKLRGRVLTVAIGTDQEQRRRLVGRVVSKLTYWQVEEVRK